MAKDLNDLYPTKNKKIASKRVNSHVLLLNLGVGQLFSLNDFSAQLWDMCDGSKKLGEILEEATGLYEEAPENVRKDVFNTLQQFIEADIVSLGF